MSLLMDALRKAEKAKQAEEDAQRKEEAPKDTPPKEKLSLSLPEEPREDVKPEPEETERRVGRLGIGGLSGLEMQPNSAPFSLALEDIDRPAETAEPQPEEATPDSEAPTVRPEETPTPSPGESEPLSLVEDNLDTGERLEVEQLAGFADGRCRRHEPRSWQLSRSRGRNSAGWTVGMTVASSPAVLPISARAMGERIETRPASASASSSPTMMYVISFSVSMSNSLTVAPNLT